MNTQYLETLPTVPNKFAEQIQSDERVIYTAKFGIFGTESGRLLSPENSKLTMTNKGIYLNNGVGVWSFTYDEVVSFETATEKTLVFFKQTYLLIRLNTTISYGNDLSLQLNGFRLYLKEKQRNEITTMLERIFNDG